MKTNRAAFTIRYPVYFILVLTILMEVTLRAFPGLLPGWYKDLFPLKGIEFTYPGILESTPLRGVPIPWMTAKKHSGQSVATTLPGDLKESGQAPTDEDFDLSRHPHALIRFDDNGFPNSVIPKQTDIVILGDSFAVAAGAENPPGIATLIRNRTALSSYVVAIPGTGPVEQSWLLKHYGLPLKPSRVIWLLFTGNDVEDSLRAHKRIQSGMKSYSDLYRGQPRPRLYSASLLMETAKHIYKTALYGEPGKLKNTLRPFSLLGQDGENTPVWFSPAYVRSLASSPMEWKKQPGWTVMTAEIERTARMLKKHSIELLIVTVPTKPAVYLRLVKKDLPLLYQTAMQAPGRSSFIPKQQRSDSNGGGSNYYLKPLEEFYEKLSTNRNSFDVALEEFCKKNEIRFLSLLPHLEKYAQTHGLGYYAADTHWAEAQEAAIAPIFDSIGVKHSIKKASDKIGQQKQL